MVDFLAALTTDLPRRVPAERTTADEVAAVFAGPEPRSWRSTARHEQLPPSGPWMYWLIMSGRGWGKTYTGANVLAEWALEQVGDYAAVAPTLGDAKKILADGPSGLVEALGDDLVSFNRTDLILFLRNGSRIVLASADVPDRLRGWNLSGAWLDELGSYGPGAKNLWDAALIPALRIGDYPRAIITTTPRRGNTVLTDLLERAEKADPTVHLTRGSTMDNAANLSPAFLEEMQRRYAGTALGEQELMGILLDDVEGALVSSMLVEATRITFDEMPDLDRVVVGVDPAVSNKDGSDYTGIVAVGIGPPPTGWHPPNGHTVLTGLPHLYVLADASVKASPEGWANRALDTAEDWAAEAIVAENNQGGAMVESTIRMVAQSTGHMLPRIQNVWASRGKTARAEPVAALWEQGRLHIVGRHAVLEAEWTTYVIGESTKSPDRLDASVWAAVGLMPALGVKGGTPVRILV